MANPPRGTHQGITKSNSGSPNISNEFEYEGTNKVPITSSTIMSATQMYVITYGQIPNWNQIPINTFAHGTIDGNGKLTHLTLDVE